MSCHPRPRSLRCIPCGTTPPMHSRDGDPAHAEHAEMSNLSILPWPISLVQTRACRASRAARPRGRRAPPPRLAEPVDASEERGEASPCLAPLGEGVQCEGAHRTRGVRREGTPDSPIESAADTPPRRRGDAQAHGVRASHDDPQDRSPVSNADAPRGIGRSNPFDAPRPQDPQAAASQDTRWMPGDASADAIGCRSPR